ncbi:hypothetical protein ACOMHN_031908 [Nucella lapillus]
MLTKLCDQFQANTEETEDMYQRCLDPLFRELLDREGEVDVDSLEESYLRHHVGEGDLNELLFLSKDPLFFPSNQHSNGTADCNQPNTVHPPMTPVRATLNSIQQLKSTLAMAANEPSTTLQHYFTVHFEVLDF